MIYYKIKGIRVIIILIYTLKSEHFVFKMSKKTQQVTVTLVEPGIIDENYHYGPFSQFWWRENIANNKNFPLFPIRIGQKTITILNHQQFVITIVVGYSTTFFLPGYQCSCNSISSEIVANPSTAISIVYQKLFKTKTRYSGPLVIGWTNEKIISCLLFDIKFCPYSFFLDSKNKIFVFGIGSSSRQDLKKGGSGYKSSLIREYHSKKTLFVSIIDDLYCFLEIYQEFQLINRIKGQTPDEVWHSIGIKNFNGTQLFGLEHPTTQLYLQQHHVPTCTPIDWNIYNLMKPLFDYHLKRRTIANVTWYQFFVNWSKNESKIIELVTSLQEIYPADYQFSDREFSAWQTLIRAAGGHNITPWSYDESEV